MSKEKAKNPNTPIYELQILARTYPKEVLQNPAIPLLLLENPSLGKQLVEDATFWKTNQNVGLLVRGLWIFALVVLPLIAFLVLYILEQMQK